jgi:hypothetical protein
MSKRAPCAFTKTDIKRAVDAVESLGKRVERVDIYQDGRICRISVVVTESGVGSGNANPWHDAVAELEARR